MQLDSGRVGYGGWDAVETLGDRELRQHDGGTGGLAGLGGGGFGGRDLVGTGGRIRWVEVARAVRGRQWPGGAAACAHGQVELLLVSRTSYGPGACVGIGGRALRRRATTHDDNNGNTDKETTCPCMHAQP